ncbi:hypothetical protein [Streptomyces sp. NPDC052225]|uniref:hypothetical protein n=1 Tax=Streptomyces sp. NPDC052225 TaxID=3154949 RepID=UPI003441D3D9
MSVRSRATRERKARIARIARHLSREAGSVRCLDVVEIAVGCGMKTSPAEVKTVLARLRLHR